MTQNFKIKSLYRGPGMGQQTEMIRCGSMSAILIRYMLYSRPEPVGALRQDWPIDQVAIGLVLMLLPTKVGWVRRGTDPSVQRFGHLGLTLHAEVVANYRALRSNICHVSKLWTGRIYINQVM